MDKVPDDIKSYMMEAYQLASRWSLPNNRGDHTNSKSIPLKSVAVIGGGTMGRGIAMAFCMAEFETILVELNDQAVENCKKELEITYAREKSFKRLKDSKIEKLRKNLQITTDFQKLQNCDLIVEAVFEEMKLKKELFTKLDGICKTSCIFGTNTSSLDLDDMSSVLQNPTKVVGIHFFNPANLIKMVEVIYGSHTSSEAVATAFEACRAIKKLPILVGNCPAFVFNRLLGVYLNQSQKLMYEYGYLPHQVDKIVTSFGFLMGPLTVADMNGLDVMEKLKSENGWPASDFEKEVWTQKRYGRKTNRGYYKYDKITHKKENDMEMEQMVREYSSRAHPSIQILNDQDAINFLLYPMMNEGLLCIEEGIIDHESLIDIMFILGFGWPVATGGPMNFGRQQGIEKVANTLIFWSSLEPENRIYQVAQTLRKVTATPTTMDKVPEEVRNYLMEAHQLAGQWSLPNNRGDHTNSEPNEINSVAIIGSGTMGKAMAICFCLAGFETVMVVRSEQKCWKELEDMFSIEKAFKRLNDARIEKIKSKLHITTDLQKLKDIDLIVESVFEDMKLKKELFTTLDGICKSSCIFGTNTSSLDLDEISSVLGDPSRLVGLHFFNPANVIRLVEVIYGSKTSPTAIATAFQACESIKKLSVLVGNCPSFVFNRLLYVYFDQSQKLMYQYGYLPHQIDKIITNFGFLMGPMTVADMNGFDVMEKLKKENGIEPNALEKEMWRQKRFGRKTNRGFYKYDKKTQRKEIDPEMEKLVRQYSQNAKKNIQILNDQDLINFMLYPTVNEGFRCLEEGVISHESLIDIMFILGFGWPINTGGPMRFGRTEGMEKVANTLLHWNTLEPNDRAYMVAEELKNIDKKNMSSKLFHLVLLASHLRIMSFNSIPGEINRELEPRFQNTIERIRKGSDADSELRQLINVIHEAWKVKGNEYVERQEEKRKRDIEELIDLCGSFCSVLGNLIDQHEDVEVSKTLQKEVNLQVAKILRQKSVVAAQEQDEEITEFLNNHLCSQHVPQAVNWVEIEAEILVLRSTLNAISSMISTLTPEYWDQESTNQIGELKANLTASTGRVLELLEAAETHHKSLIDTEFILSVTALTAN
ncbi:hypothetical protein L3Y34_004503 [Caenorhabditis briggsae]|uniref:Uncharacterized protein n=1 Tax=Caenorhabditis briggsae TaxID=6238 RepID=A0AAE9ADZ3_CAEBR|nr:hypothetical protein L3Y34_004503 [Caenorhabditis briggsae]